MGFNKRDKEKVEEKRESQKEQLEGEQQERLRMQDGANVYYLVPPTGDSVEPVVDRMVHYRPFHRCGRPDPVFNSDIEGNYEKNRSFQDCYRCQKAFNRWDNLNRPANGPEKSAFLSNMESIRCFVQVIDFSPFFEVGSNDVPEPKMKVVKSWLEEFVNYVMLGSEEKEETELPEEMPEDMKFAARNSPGILGMNSSVSKSVRSSYNKKCLEIDDDPLFMPSEHLLVIERENEGDTFEVNGQTRHKKTYEVDWTLKGVMGDWTEFWSDNIGQKFFDSLEELIGDTIYDLENIPAASDDLEDRALAMKRLTNEEIREYLELSEHSFSPTDGDDVEGEVEDEDDDLVDPDDFDDSVLGTEDMAEAEELREEMENETQPEAAE